MTAGPDKMRGGADARQPADGRGVSMQVHPEASVILNLDPSLVREFIGSALREHARLLAEGSAAVLKNAPESAVTLVDLPGRPRVCVKEFRWRGYLHALKGFFRPSQGVRTFRNGRRLRESGILAAVPLALVREVNLGVTRREWVVMEALHAALELDRFIVSKVSSGWGAEEKRGLVRQKGLLGVERGREAGARTAFRPIYRRHARARHLSFGSEDVQYPGGGRETHSRPRKRFLPRASAEAG
jgi:hypothetical protein